MLRFTGLFVTDVNKHVGGATVLWEVDIKTFFGVNFLVEYCCIYSKQPPYQLFLLAFYCNIARFLLKVDCFSKIGKSARFTSMNEVEYTVKNQCWTKMPGSAEFETYVSFLYIYNWTFFPLTAVRRPAAF